MKKILIIGCGQLGSRHLQSLALIDKELKIHLVDPFEESLVKASSSFKPHPSFTQIITTSTSLEAIKDTFFDTIINASTADVRFEILKEIKKLNIKYDLLILEKVLFQKLSHYEQAENFIDTNKTYVNCPRRLYDFYQEIKNLFKKDLNFSATFKATNWGLCCNSVHYIDLIQYLTGNFPSLVLTEKLEKKIYPSKRNGFIEFFGELNVQYGPKGTLNLFCLENNITQELEIHQDGMSIKVFETLGKIEIKKSDEVLHKTIRIPYQSELTGKLLNIFFASGKCQLSTYDEAKKNHLPLVQSLLAYYNFLSEKNSEILPIT